jgi:hypothetical protein
MGAVQGELTASKSDPILLGCLAELYLVNKQPAKALPYFLRLRRPDVFDLIREHNLFTAVQDQALLLIEFDQDQKGNQAVQLLVDHTYSIPVCYLQRRSSSQIDRVVVQLEAKPQYLYMYLDALFEKDQHLCMPYSDRMVCHSRVFANSRWNSTPSTIRTA